MATPPDDGTGGHFYRLTRSDDNRISGSEGGVNVTLIQQRQQALVRMTERAPIIQTMGMRLSYNDQHSAIWRMPYHPQFDHGLRGIHGGVFATLLDNAGWFTIAPHYEHWIATVEFQSRLLEHVEGKDLWSIGFPVKIGKRLATATMEICTEHDNQLVAIGSGTFSVTSVKGVF